MAALSIHTNKSNLITNILNLREYFDIKVIEALRIVCRILYLIDIREASQNIFCEEDFSSSERYFQQFS